MRVTYDCAEILGWGKNSNQEVATGSPFITGVGSNPTDVIYFSWCFASIDSSTALVYVEYEIDYDVIYSQLDDTLPAS